VCALQYPSRQQRKRDQTNADRTHRNEEEVVLGSDDQTLGLEKRDELGRLFYYLKKIRSTFLREKQILVLSMSPSITVLQSSGPELLGRPDYGVPCWSAC
jgi:hypothetical protein